MEIVLASGNRGKLRELSRALSAFGVTLRPQSDFGVDEAVEDGETFEANALIKARHAAAATGLPALADDSGICVDALQGAPGVHSARFAGSEASDADNVARLLRDLDGVDQRGARFVCVLALVKSASDEAPLFAHGEWCGEIAHTPSGAGGFGYDPVFVDPQDGRTAAELEADEKARRSHRGAAIRNLEQQFAAWLEA